MYNPDFKNLNQVKGAMNLQPELTHMSCKLFIRHTFPKSYYSFLI